MDPQQTLMVMLNAILSKDVETAIDAAGELNGWIGRGGFEPDYDRAVWLLFDRLVTENE